MAFVRVEDEVESMEIVIFPRLFSQTASLWQEDQMVLITGKVDDRDEELKILADSAQLLTKDINPDHLNNIGLATKPAKKPEANNNYLYIKVPSDCTPEKFANIKKALNEADKGLHKVALLLPKAKNRYQKLETNFIVKKDNLLRTKLEKVLGPGSVSK